MGISDEFPKEDEDIHKKGETAPEKGLLQFRQVDYRCPNL